MYTWSCSCTACGLIGSQGQCFSRQSGELRCVTHHLRWICCCGRCWTRFSSTQHRQSLSWSVTREALRSRSLLQSRHCLLWRWRSHEPPRCPRLLRSRTGTRPAPEREGCPPPTPPSRGRPQPTNCAEPPSGRVGCPRPRRGAPTSNLEEYDTFKCSFQDTELRCTLNGLRFNPVVFDAHARGWSDPAPTCLLDCSTRQRHAPPPSKRVSSLLHRDLARAVLPRVRIVATTNHHPRRLVMAIGRGRGRGV